MKIYYRYILLAVLCCVNTVSFAQYYVGISVPNGDTQNHIDALNYGISHSYSMTGTVFPGNDIETDTDWDINNWGAFDHTNATPAANHSFDLVVQRHYQNGKKLLVHLPINRSWRDLNGESPNRSVFWSGSDSHMRVDGMTPTYQKHNGPVPNEAYPSLATQAVKNYANGLMLRFFKRYLNAINDGTILAVGFVMDAAAEAQMPIQFIAPNGSNQFSPPPQGDFHPDAIARFKMLFPQYQSESIPSIANAARNSDLGRKFWWHEADMLRETEWNAIDYVKANVSGLTRTKFFMVDAGSYADGQTDARRTYNIQARTNRSEYLLIKSNDNPANQHAVDYMWSAAKRINGIPFNEPTPANHDFQGFFYEVKDAIVRAKNQGTSISLLDIVDDGITYNIAQQAGVLNLSSPITPTSVTNLTLSLSDILNNGGNSYIQQRWESAKTLSTMEYVNFTIVDDVAPNTPQPTSYNKVLFVGNSITSHGPAPNIGWYGNYGMAASAAENDYVHRVMANINCVNPNATYYSMHAVPWEQDWNSFDYSSLADRKNENYDLIIMRVAENINDGNVYTQGMKQKYLDLIDGIRQPNSRVIITNSFWGNHNNTNAVLQQVASERGYSFVNLSDLGQDPTNTAAGLFSDPGVAAHPGDLGMSRIADRILAALNITCNNGCSNPPAAPTLVASPSTITSGGSSTLSASGCAGTVSWNTPGGSTTVTPTVTTTYTATCTENGCTSSSASVTVTVPPTPGVNCNTLEGFFDTAGCTALSGWVYDASQPNAAVSVDIYEGSTLIQGNFLAGDFRQDLLNAGKGNGAHGFSIPVPNSLKDGQNHAISIRVNGCTYTLNNSPLTVNCPGNGCSNPPAAPTLVASPSTITSGGSSTLSASGCAGTVSWNTPGGSTTVTPTVTTTYTATCTENGCTSSSASVTVTVPPTPGVNCNTLEGNFEGAYCEITGLSGWVYDASQPNAAVSVDIYEGSTLIQGNFLAGDFRQDLLNAGKGNGAHGFSIPVPNSLKDGQNHAISIRVNGCTYTLNNSPLTVNCPGNGCSNPPAAPTLVASPSTITSGGSSTLSASGCAGTVSWNTPGGSTTVTPTVTTTYTATCTENGCTSSSASVTVTVPPTPGVNCNTLEGNFEGAYCEITGLSGWVYDASQPNAAVSVDIYEGSTLIQGNFLAGDFRQDLLNAGKGNGAHGFSIPVPNSLKDGQNHAISIRVNGCTYILNNSPKNLNCSSGSRLSAEITEILETDDKLIVAPNPSSGDFEATFYVEPGRKATLSITDMMGRQVWHKGLTGEGKHKLLVRLPTQSVGNYVLLLQKESTSRSSKVETKKIIVIK